MSSTSTHYGWQTVATRDDDGVGGTNSLQLEESLVGYPRPGTQLPPATISNAQIQVIAPATLPEGYEFDAIVGNTTLKVKVPLGGVEKGQSFPVSVTPDMLLRPTTSSAGNVVIGMPGNIGPSATISIPVGHWRDSLFHCFRYGPCHPHCWTSFCCSLLAAGQIISRLRLNWRGFPATSIGQSENAFLIIFIITLVHFGMIAMLYIAVFTLDSNDYSKPEPIGGWNKPADLELFIIQFYQLMKYSYFIVTGLWLYKIRVALRAKYAIPGENICDCLLSFFCHCCVAAQMLRHTTDYDVYPSYTCSATGLPASVPSIV